MRHDPGLAASPPVRYILKMERSGYSPFPLSSAVNGQALREAQCAAYGGTRPSGPSGPSGVVGRGSMYVTRVRYTSTDRCLYLQHAATFVTHHLRLPGGWLALSPLHLHARLWSRGPGFPVASHRGRGRGCPPPSSPSASLPGGLLFEDHPSSRGSRPADHAGVGDVFSRASRS